MFWFAVGKAVADGLGGINSANQSVIQAATQSKNINNSIVEANVANSIRTSYRVGMLNLQRALDKQQQAQAGFDVSAQALRASGSAEANAAASGTIGASVDAVLDDINKKMGEALADQEQDWQIKQTNYNTNLEEIIYQGKAAIRDAYQVELPSQSDIFKSALGQGLTSFASSYAMSKMNLGLGNRTTGESSVAMPAGGLNTGSASGFSLTTPQRFGYNFDLGGNRSWSNL